MPAASTIDAGAANEAGENWDRQQPGSEEPLTESFEIVPRPAGEVETPAAPAAVNATQSWADEPVETAPAATNANDGFHEVQHNRGRGRGGHQGEGRGSFRGRGRGDFRGRGRGGRGRGDGFRGGPRGGGSFRGRGESQPQQ